MTKCEVCNSEYEPRWRTLPDPLDGYIRATGDADELRRLCIIRSREMTQARAQVEVLRDMLMEMLNE